MKKIFLLIITTLICNSAFALETPMERLSKYFKNGELVKIPSYNVKRWPNQYLSIKDGSYKNSPIEVDAFIAFPKKGEGPFPVMMFAHSSGGAELFTNEWFKFNRLMAKALLKKGVVVMFLDNFSARGQKHTYADQSTINHYSTYIDAFKSLEYLSKDPKVNIKKVGITGWSRGGMISLMVSEKRLRDALTSKDLYFAAALPRTVGCWSVGMFLNPQPIKETKTWMVLGGADDFTRADRCVDLGKKYKANGADIEVTVKKRWGHGFTANYDAEYEADNQVFSKCAGAFMTDEGNITYVGSGSYPECVTMGAHIGGNKGGTFKKPFLKFFTENLLN